MLAEQKISWDKAHYLWNDFKLGTEYQQYLFDVYGITVEEGGRVIWNHVFNVIEVTVVQQGGPGEDIPTGKKKPEQKRIKLIFIMKLKETLLQTLDFLKLKMNRSMNMIDI
jgi:hypothetical protein